MAVSPTVQAFQQQAQGPSGNAEQSFTKRFGDAAFNLFRAKAPALLPFVTTFHILSSDLEKETGLGVFVIRAGGEQRYVPVVLAGGAVNSCEMLYNRAEDRFYPLSEQAVADIQGRNSMTDATVLRRDPHVEDTRQLFRDMLRPPASSNVVLASVADGVASLPDRAKSVAAGYLEEHPELLAKLAVFYPPARLGEKLAVALSRPEPPAPGPAVLTLETVTKEAAAFLRQEEKEELLRHGYVVKRASGNTLVLPTDTLPQAVETALQVEVWPPLPDTASQARVTKAFALCCTAEGFRREPVIVAGEFLLGADGARADLRERGALLAERCEQVSEEDLRAMDAVDCKGLGAALARLGMSLCRVLVFCPARHGGYLRPRCAGGNVRAGDFSVRSVEEETYLTPPPDLTGTSITISSGLRFGWLRRPGEIVVPRGALFAVIDMDRPRPIAGMIGSFEEWRSLLHGLGTPLRTARDGVALHVTDMRRGKTASFAKEAEAAAWLNATFGLTGPQIRAVLEHPRCVLFAKQAFETPEGFSGPFRDAQEPDFTEDTAQATLPMFDPSLLEAWADTGDPEMVDTGILAAFAGDPDIKALLLDYLPDFMTVLDRVGRVILLFSLEKQKFEDFYGRDEYARTLGGCRKIFKQVGELVHTLRQYVTMH